MASNKALDAIYGSLIDKGFTPLQSAVLTGNIQQESGGNPVAWNPAEGAGGLLQWRLDRLTNLQKYAADNGRDIRDPGTQIDFLASEMQGPEAKNAAGFLAAKDPQSANQALKSFIRYKSGTENARLANSMAYVGQQAPVATVPSRDELLKQWEPQAAPGSATTPAPDSGVPSRDDLLKQWAPMQAQSATKGAPAAWMKRPAQVAAPTPIDVVNGPQTPGAGGFNPMAAQGDAAPAGPQAPLQPKSPTMEDLNSYQPSMAGQGFDALSAFANSAVNAIPVAGPWLTDVGHNVDAAFASAVEGRPVSPEERAKIDAAQQTQFPLQSFGGTVAGTVAPLALVGSLPIANTALGMSGSLPMRMLMGTLSGAGITGADTLARGGTPEQAGQNALLGAGLGLVAPGVNRLLDWGFQSFKGPSAEKVLSKALAADDISPGSVNQLLASKGPETVVADLGPNLQNLAGGIASVPGKAQTIVKNELLKRAAGAGNRLTGAVANNLGEGLPIGKTVQQITDEQSAAAKPLYAAIWQKPLPVDGDIAAVIRTPMGEKAFRDAAVMAANDGEKVDGLTVGLVDYAKRSLDDLASSAARAGNNNVARQAAGMAGKLRDAADTVEPGYAKARNAFAGPAKILDAIDFGKTAFARATSPEDLKSALAAMTDSEREGVLLGAQSAVQDLIGNARTDAAGVKSAFASSSAKEKLALLIGKKQADNIADAIEKEATFAGTTHAAVGNSLTAARQEMQKLVSPETANLPKPQSMIGLAIAGLEKARNALVESYRGGQNARLANMLMSGTMTPKIAARASALQNPNALLAPASVPLLMKQQAEASGKNPLMWALPARVRAAASAP